MRSYFTYVLAFVAYLVAFLGFYRPLFLNALDVAQLGNYILFICMFTGLLLLASYAITSRYFPKLIATWTMSNEIIWITSHFCLIGVYNIILVKKTASIADTPALNVFLATCLVGLIPSIIDIYMRTKRNPPEQEISAKSMNVMYVQADGNYIHVYRNSGHSVERELLRSPLSSFHSQHQPHLVRVHKSYLVNASVIENIQGNSNGGRISLINNVHIPYSRGFYENVKALCA